MLATIGGVGPGEEEENRHGEEARQRRRRREERERAMRVRLQRGGREVRSERLEDAVRRGRRNGLEQREHRGHRGADGERHQPVHLAAVPPGGQVGREEDRDREHVADEAVRRGEEQVERHDLMEPRDGPGPEIEDDDPGVARQPAADAGRRNQQEQREDIRAVDRDAVDDDPRNGECPDQKRERRDPEARPLRGFDDQRHHGDGAAELEELRRSSVRDRRAGEDREEADAEHPEGARELGHFAPPAARS